MPTPVDVNASRNQSCSTDIAISATLRPRRDNAAAKFAATCACASPVGLLTIIALGSRSVAIDIAARPRYASAANEFGSATTANSSPSAGMIDSTGAEKVSAASSGSRMVRSARSTSRAAPSAKSRPPNRPPSAGSVVAWTLATRDGRGLRDDLREHVGGQRRESLRGGLLPELLDRRQQLDALEREVERVNRALLRNRRRTGGAVPVLPPRSEPLGES